MKYFCSKDFNEPSMLYGFSCCYSCNIKNTPVTMIDLIVYQTFEIHGFPKFDVIL